MNRTLTHASNPSYRYIAVKTKKNLTGGTAEPGAADKKSGWRRTIGCTRLELLLWVGEDV
jgi:hypothetical protein